MCEYCRTKIGKCGDIESDNVISLLKKGTDFSVDVSVMPDSLLVCIDSVDDDGNAGWWKSWNIDINYCPMCGRVINNKGAFDFKVLEAKQTVVDIIEEHKEAAVSEDILNNILSGIYSDAVRVKALKELVETKIIEKELRNDRWYYLELKPF